MTSQPDPDDAPSSRDGTLERTGDGGVIRFERRLPIRSLATRAMPGRRTDRLGLDRVRHRPNRLRPSRPRPNTDRLRPKPR